MPPNSDDPLQEEPRGERVPPRRGPPAALADFAPSRRTWYVFRGATLVGYTRFEVPLPQPERVCGRFHPQAGYADVRATFRLYDEARRGPAPGAALAAFVAARDALGLTLVTEGGGEEDGYVEHLSEWGNGVVAIHAVLRRRGTR